MQSPQGALIHLDPSRLHLKTESPSSSNSRILDIPCKVCGDFSSGKHYNIFACDGCAGFFKRSIRRNRQYICKAKDEGSCIIDKAHRNQCRACRLKKCQLVGMNKDAVQHERGPRNSTIRRQQLSNYFNEGRVMMTPPGNVLNLAMPKYDSSSPGMEHGVPLVPSTNFLFNNILPIPRVPQLSIPPMFAPAFINPSAYCESAAQLLFINVQWIRSVASFTSLPLSDQLILLEESWLDLFILGIAQILPFMNVQALVQASGLTSNEGIMKEVHNFEDILKKIREFQFDPHEIACLRAIALFRTSFDPPRSSASFNRNKTLVEQSKINTIQDDAQIALNKYISVTHPKQPLRFSKELVLMTSAFRTVSDRTIEELFFKKVIQDTPIVAIICNMYSSKVVTNGSSSPGS